jgi:hypothetical protein
MKRHLVSIERRSPGNGRREWVTFGEPDLTTVDKPLDFYVALLEMFKSEYPLKQWRLTVQAVR